MLSHARLAIAPLMLLAIAGSAVAQNALGDGRGLDNNLQRGSGGINGPRRDIQDDLNYRNAIVTGNVGRGREFRGETGYTAANDFRGHLGSNDIFDFVRDSGTNFSGAYTGGYSGLATQNLRGLGAVQMQLDMPLIGQSNGYGGELIIERGGTGMSSGRIDPPSGVRPEYDPFPTLARSLRSTSAYYIDNAAQPEVIAIVDAPKPKPGEVVPEGVPESKLLTASELHGVKMFTDFSPAIGRAQYPDATKRKSATDAADPNAEPERTNTGDLVKPEAANTVAEPLSGTYESALAQMRVRANKVELASGSKPPAPEVVVGPETELPDLASDNADPMNPKPMDALSSSLDQLRESLTRNKPTPGILDPTLIEPEDPENAENPEELDLLGQPKRDAKPKSKTAQAAEKAQRLLRGESDITIQTLQAPQSSNQIFDEHMRKGEEAMNQARWFDAEERFTAAISIKKGDPMAAAGRVNAQLSAGMLLSSAVNLRNMLRAYPELIGVRFGPQLLPAAERLEKLRAQLRARSERDSALARDAGFLLAYLGHQTGDQKDIIDGFAIVERVEKAMEFEPDPLDAACRAVWVK